MTDTVSKNTGNSRSLRTVANALTLYPTHEAMIAAMVDGTFPIDLGPLNPAGVAQRGDDLNKANLLKDATAALYGKSAAAVPDEIFAEARTLIADVSADQLVILSGSYTGTNTYGYTRTIYCSGYRPYAFFLSMESRADSTAAFALQYVSVSTEAVGLVFPTVSNYGAGGGKVVVRLRDGDILLSENTGENNLNMAERRYFWGTVCKKL